MNHKRASDHDYSFTFVDRMLDATRTLTFRIMAAVMLAGILSGLALGSLYFGTTPPAPMVKLCWLLLALLAYIVYDAATMVNRGINHADR